jgi:hypothetical protein
MNRRRFLRQAGTLASAAFVLPGTQSRRRYKMGLQLFTIRQPMAQDPAGTLKQVAALGYEEVETYGFDPQLLSYYGQPGKTFAQQLREHNITCPSGSKGRRCRHTPWTTPPPARRARGLRWRGRQPGHGDDSAARARGAEDAK